MSFVDQFQKSILMINTNGDIFLKGLILFVNMCILIYFLFLYPSMSELDAIFMNYEKRFRRGFAYMIIVSLLSLLYYICLFWSMTFFPKINIIIGILFLVAPVSLGVKYRSIIDLNKKKLLCLQIIAVILAGLLGSFFFENGNSQVQTSLPSLTAFFQAPYYFIISVILSGICSFIVLMLFLNITSEWGMRVSHYRIKQGNQDYYMHYSLENGEIICSKNRMLGEASEIILVKKENIEMIYADYDNNDKKPKEHKEKSIRDKNKRQ